MENLNTLTIQIIITIITFIGGGLAYLKGSNKILAISGLIILLIVIYADGLKPFINIFISKNSIIAILAVLSLSLGLFYWYEKSLNKIANIEIDELKEEMKKK